MSGLKLLTLMQVRLECCIQPAEQDNLQLLSLPMDCVGCTRGRRSGILYCGLLPGSQERLLPKVGLLHTELPVNSYSCTCAPLLAARLSIQLRFTSDALVVVTSASTDLVSA